MATNLIEFPLKGRTRPGPCDPDLAEAARLGDRSAFTELIRRHQGTVRGMMRRLAGGNQADADDLAQSAFLTAWRRMETFRGGTFKSWICTIAYREFLQMARRRKPEMSETVEERGSEDSAISGVRFDTDKAIASLPEQQRTAIILSLGAGMSHSEIAATTGWPIGTVKSHINRGKSALREKLAGYGAA